jgi:protein N-terminal amidase
MNVGWELNVGGGLGGGDRLESHTVDLVCLPEMIFTGESLVAVTKDGFRLIGSIAVGYMFPDAHSIRPYLEHPRHGPTALFCSDLASSLQCYVTAGYPEQLSPDEVRVQDTSRPTAASPDRGTEVEKEQVGANSAVLYGPDGCWVGGYRKTNLFRTDLTWAKAGKSYIHSTAPF